MKITTINEEQAKRIIERKQGLRDVRVGEQKMIQCSNGDLQLEVSYTYITGMSSRSWGTACFDITFNEEESQR
jgi:hypothetical protein